MFADSTTNTAMCRCLFCFGFFLPLCRYHLMAVLRSICHRPSHLRMKPRPLKTTSPLPSQLSRKTEQKKKKKIHNAETHIRELQSSINMIKIFVRLTIMDITQSVDPRNNIFLELMNMSRNACLLERTFACRTHLQ